MARFTVFIENNILSEFKDEKFGTKAQIDPIKNNIINIFKYEPFSNEFESALNSLYEQLVDGNSMGKYYVFMVKLKSCLLDLYTMSRIYKIMSKSMNIHPYNRTGVNEAVHPLVVMCYFGNKHIENINTLIKDNYIKEGFSILKSEKGGEINRCLNFSEKYCDFNKKISRLKSKRTEHEEKLEK